MTEETAAAAPNSGAAAFFFAFLLPRLSGNRLRHKKFLVCKPKYLGKAKTFSYKSPGKHQFTKTPAEMVLILSGEFEIHTKPKAILQAERENKSV